MKDTMSPKALNDMGDAYFYGIDRPINHELAYTFYKQAADMDNPVGLFNVGMYFYHKSDFKKAIEFLDKSRACGHSPAVLLLADMYKNGYGFHKSRKKAFKMYLQAANLNDIDGYNAVGECYKNGYGCAKNPEKAFSYYQKSADHGDMTGELNVGLYYWKSSSYKKNPEPALTWLDKAATHDSLEAKHLLQEIYQTHNLPYFKKKSLASLREMAFYYTESLAKANDIKALKTVADTYYNGSDITKKNHEKSALYYKSLSDMGDQEGKYGYAVSLLYGQGVPKDVGLAKKLLEECAIHSHPMALTRLGDIFRLGLNVPVDNEEAKKWYLEAAKHNDPEALMNLGLLNYRQVIEGHNPTLAYNFMETAAKKGYFQAWYWLGIFHDKGIGCEPSFHEAQKSFEKAIQQGSLGAKYKFAAMIIDETRKGKNEGKKTIALFQTARQLFTEYIADSMHNAANSAYAMAYLGEMYRDGLGMAPNPHISRFWYESAAEADLSSAMVEMYRILKDKEFDQAMQWLNKAIQDTTAADAFYELGLVYLYGIPDNIQIDVKMAKAYLETAARQNHKGALEKLMML
ncbi:MAG: tetratricopeptide repeat protein [Candidatus Izemoplasmatales bacterium]|nr:tetratricopeptide repeat protein [Candidatus Izemoplasmatales bacterium]